MSLETYLQNTLLRLEEQTALLEQKTADYLKKQENAKEHDAEAAALKARLNQLVDEKNKLLEEKKLFVQFKETWAKERPLLLKMRDQLTAERSRLVSERDRLLTEKEQLVQKKDAEKKEATDALETSLATVRAECDRLSAENKTLSDDAAAFATEKEKNAVLEKNLADETAQKETLSIELDGLKRAYDELKKTAADVSARLDATVTELKELRKQEEDNGERTAEH